MANLDVVKARSNFPALSSGYIFADNAGGSQVTKGVIDRIIDYLTNTNVQLGADYSVSVESTRRVESDGPMIAAKLLNANSPDEIVFSGSSTQNLENLSRGLENDIRVGDEFILTGEHEANVGAWKKLAARRGATVKYWKPAATLSDNPYSFTYKFEDLLPLISSKTRIVAFSACSNILGTIVPVKDVIAAVRVEATVKGARKVEISLDCVAYAPHRLMDVQEWDVDFCVFSFYKVYGPHTSALYVRSSVLQSSVSSIAHHFIAADKTSSKFELGGPGYELVYGATGVIPYLLSLTPSNTLAATFFAFAMHEQNLLKPLLTFLTEPAQRARGVRVVGNESLNLWRVPTVSFVVVGRNSLRSKDVVKGFDDKGGIGIRWGHFYAYTLLDEASPKIDMDDGVVRISLVHYNTVEEVERIIEVLREILG